MTDKLEKLRSFDEADREILQSRPDVAALWDKTARRRAISSLLLKARLSGRAKPGPTGRSCGLG